MKYMRARPAGADRPVAYTGKRYHDPSGVTAARYLDSPDGVAWR